MDAFEILRVLTEPKLKFGNTDWVPRDRMSNKKITLIHGDSVQLKSLVTQSFFQNFQNAPAHHHVIEYSQIERFKNQ